MTKISVVIPTYNRAAFLLEALDSVFKQTYTNLEILVIDDGSKDNTSEVVKPFEGKIRYIKQINQGVSAARNKGIAESTGDFIAFLDSDDLWQPNHVAQLHSAITNNSGVEVAFSAFSFIGDDADADECNTSFDASLKNMLANAFVRGNDGVWLSNENLLQELLVKGFPFRIPGSMINRAFINQHKIIFDQRIRYTEEAQFFTETALYCKFAFVEKSGLLVTRHSENVGDLCYQDKIASSYAFRIERSKAVFTGKVQGQDLVALNLSIWFMELFILNEKVQNKGIIKKIIESTSFVIKFPSMRSVKSVIKIIIGIKE